MIYFDEYQIIHGMRTKELVRAHLRFRALGEVSCARIISERVRLKRTLRLVSTELAYLRKQSIGPSFVIGVAGNGGRGIYYRWDEVVRFFGGLTELFSGLDYPEHFDSGKPSCRHRAHRTRVGG